MGTLQTTLPNITAPLLAATGSTIGVTVEETADLIHEVEEGLPFSSFELLARLTRQSVAELGQVLNIPERTLARRKIAGKFTPDESGRLVRVAAVVEKAVALFDWETAPAIQWMLTAKAAFGGETPLRYCRTELGAREVEKLIGRLEHGVFS